MRKAPGALTARDGLWMATREGARALGLEHEIGSMSPGKRADLIVVDRDRPHIAPGPNPCSTLIYAVRGSDVRTTVVDGTLLVDEFISVNLDRAEIVFDAGVARVSPHRAPAFEPGRGSAHRSSTPRRVR